MLSINTNLSSLIAQNSMSSATNKLNQAIERMSTGFKINHASDNAANYSISTNMTTKMSAYMVAEDNTAMGLDMVTTASESLSLIEDKLNRLRALAVQTSNGTYGTQSKEAINSEANALVDEIERIYNNTEYNGINALKGRVNSVEESKFIKDVDRRDTSKMTTLESVEIDKKLESGTYSISTAEELAKLATMCDNGLIGTNTEFVLGADIDLNGYANWNPIGEYALNNFNGCFTASFDGNGYVISNLKISSGVSIGLFSWVNGEIKNLGIENANISGSSSVGILAGTLTGNISNCYAIGEVKGFTNVGGLVGYTDKSILMNCYTDVNVTGLTNTNYGGLCAVVSSNTNIKNCFSLGNVSTTGNGKIGGITSKIGANVIVENCYSKGVVTGNGEFVDDFIPIIEGEIINCGNFDTITNNAKIFNHNSELLLQIGINSDSNNQISTNLSLSLSSLNFFRQLGIRTGSEKLDQTHIKKIDIELNKILAKQTELGAVTNRLESALDEIAIQYDNLVSSRSTLRDADMAKLSSEYIKMQILQQASATLLSTANQSPSIALQLI